MQLHIPNRFHDMSTGGTRQNQGHINKVMPLTQCWTFVLDNTVGRHFAISSFRMKHALKRISFVKPSTICFELLYVFVLSNKRKKCLENR